jgi:sarcosine oxidase gamma subunit
MFTPAGNRAIRHVVWRASRMLRAGRARKTVMASVRRLYGAVEDRYEEAFDTAVRESFADELDRWLVAAGYEPIDSYDEFAV